jgi:5-oxopent-3-ene-1,2,5-tricarboxylate decarboxylase / 2-hydroxyhepta-2,4-diene-1,7-dioate isomerase
VIRPRGCRFLNYEGEVVIVIGRICRNVRVADALDYVAGYTLANDFAIHDFRHADRGSMLRVKGADTLAPIGPGLVRDWAPGDQVLRTRVNGEVVQESGLRGMVFPIAYLIADSPA